MNKKSLVLLKTLLLSTSQINIYRKSKDKKRRGRVIANFIGFSILYIFLIAYSVGTCIGYGELGLTDIIPDICAMTLSGIAFMFTLLKTNGYLFHFKEYDMLMSLPFDAKTIAADKFLYMYIKSLPWYLSLSLSMMVGYGLYKSPLIWVYFVWIILTLFVPVIPMVVASFLGFLIAKVSTKFKKSNIIQTVLCFILLIICFSMQYIIEAIFKNNETEVVLESIYEKVSRAGAIYLPAGWFSGSVNQGSLFCMFLLIAVTIGLFEIAFFFVGMNYRKINSALASHVSVKAYIVTKQKRNSVVKAIAYKEFRRFIGSTVYMTNASIGELFALILGIASLFVGMDRIVSIITKGAPISMEMLYPAIPLIVYFLIGMMATTACSPSLEGKNYWIIQSLPISEKTLYQGKMLFNMYLTVPFSLFATVCLCFSMKVPLLNSVIYLIQSFLLCCFSTAWGCVCGIKHIRLDWENEIEVVKQGAAVAIYLLPNMFVTMGLVVLVVFLGTVMNSLIVTIILTLITAILASVSYLRVLSLTKK